MVEIINECLSDLNHLGGAFSRYAVAAFLQSAVLVVVLFGLDLLLRQRVRAVVRYCLWLLVLVKLILPPTLSLPTGIGYWAPRRLPVVASVPQRPAPGPGFEPMAREIPPIPQVADGPAPVVEPAAVSPVEPDPAVALAPVRLTPITWRGAVLLFWLAGMLAFAALIGQRMRFVRGLVAASAPGDGQMLVLLEQCRQDMRLGGRIQLRTSDALTSPAVCGLLRPTILMPAALVAKLSPDELKATLIHELAHVKRADLWVNAVQTVLQVVYFYNPFVWLANAIIRRTCEEAVDETVLVALGGPAMDYSDTLIRISETAFWKADFGLRLIGVAESKRALKRRIRHMVTRPVPKSARIGALGTIGILVIAVVLLPMARGERAGREASTPSAATITESNQVNSSAEEGSVVVDPNTGVKFVLTKTISGANNVIAHVNKLIMSPDMRFLLFWGRVIPLDGSETFSYTELSGDVREVAVSPDGRYIAHGQNTIWLQPVSPQTLRPDGPGKKLIDLKGERLVGAWVGQRALFWTRDSQVVFFRTEGEEGPSRRYAFSAVTGEPVPYPDAASTGLPSPDGTRIALTDTEGIWVKSVGDGAARVLHEQGPAPASACWSRDGKWLIGFQPGAPLADARFVSYPEGRVYPISMPNELAKDNNTICLGASTDGETLYFYQAGYDLSYGVWAASVEGMALKDMDIGWFYGYGAFQWSYDGKAIIHQDARYSYTKDFTDRPGDRALFSSPLSGEKATPLALSPVVSAGRGVWASPDSKWLLFTPAPESDSSTLDLNVIPLSIADHEASGPNTVLFRMTRPRQGNSRAVGGAWSPDSTRVAVAGKADSVKEHDIWVTFVDGRKPIRLTETAAIEEDLEWSPDGTMLAFVSDDAGARAMKVIPSVGGEAVVVRQLVGEETPFWVWSPDGKSLTMAEGGMLVRQPLSGGQAEPIVDLETFGITELEWFDWSPDGSTLALANHTRNRGGNNGVLASWGQIVFARVEGGRLQKTGLTDLGPSLWAGMFAWSPDSTHVACGYEGIEPVGPGGRLYTVAVDDIAERIKAGAIAPTGPKPAEPATANSPAESKPARQLEPIAGSVFSDNFDNGLSKYWQIVPGNPEASPPPAHAVENGQLMLSNSSARLSQVDWSDYRVTVRLCVKEGPASGRGIASIQTRATPFELDGNMLERYALLLVCSNDAPACMLRLALYYHNASGAGRGATLDKNRCPLAPGQWYKVAFEVRGERLRVYLDDELMIETTDARLSRGSLWISAAESPILFDDFSVQRLP